MGMCFNATASYASGLAITAVGVSALPAVEDRRELGFAALPVLFGVHQLLEGAIWDQVETSAPLPVHSPAVFAWLVIAWVLLPAGVAWSVLAFEPERSRRRIQLGLALVGALVSAGLTGVLLTGAPGAGDAHAHLTYDLPVNAGWPLAIGYAAATCGPLLASSRRYVVVAGLAMGAALLVSALAYAASFASVWCFLAACISLIISGHYLLARRRRRRAELGVTAST